ncbi:MAG: tRNA N6-adenosine threonylcarbamoyltransferase [Chlamydiae bacterium]|nr:tRNA N6-adenosine threonylcarbamoyltransferase [Chlamydiota bacterium]
MYVLGIESTCDETAVGIVQDGTKILSNVISTQIEAHRPFGGVYPELASREHVVMIIPTIEQALSEAGLTLNAIDLIAVAHGPGLVGSLLIGLNAAKTLSLALAIPFVGVNHVEAHLYAAMMSHQAYLFPSLGVVISGGHTFIVHIHDVGHYSLIGTTVDDAIGEAFDKVAQLLGLPYPGGPAVEQLALKGDPSKFSFKAGNVKGRPLDFSFSGLKTNVLYTLKGNDAKKSDPTLLLSENDRADVAAAFQETALKDIVGKTVKAMDGREVKAIYVGGGVSHNKRLSVLFEEKELTVPVFLPGRDLSADNGAMIAGLGYHRYKLDGASPFTLEPDPRPGLFSRS